MQVGLEMEPWTQSLTCGAAWRRRHWSSKCSAPECSPKVRWSSVSRRRADDPRSTRRRCQQRYQRLILALKVLDLAPGDEVITSVFTFVATINAILESGATMRFADVSDIDFAMTAESAAAAVNERDAWLLPSTSTVRRRPRAAPTTRSFGRRRRGRGRRTGARRDV